MTPDRRRSRKSDRFMLACATLGLVSAIVVGVYIGPVLLDTSGQADENEQQIDGVEKLTRDTARLARRIDREGRRRRDQSCKQDERRHLDDVKRLRRTYAFLERLPQAARGTFLTKAIIQQLPEVENDARHDVAPPYCDEPGIGLPEPDPKVPDRRDFSRLLQRP